MRIPRISMNRPPAGGPDPGPVGRRCQPYRPVLRIMQPGPAARAVQRRRPPVSRHHHEWGKVGGGPSTSSRCPVGGIPLPFTWPGDQRGDKMDLPSRSPVEPGVTRITLLSERCGRRCRRIGGEEARAAAEGGDQRLRAVRPQYVPEVRMPMELDDAWLAEETKEPAQPAPAGRPTASTPCRYRSTGAPADRPGRGLSSDEIARTVQGRLQGDVAGPRGCAKTETAALTAITALQCRFGDLADSRPRPGPPQGRENRPPLVKGGGEGSSHPPSHQKEIRMTIQTRHRDWTPSRPSTSKKGTPASAMLSKRRRSAAMSCSIWR